MYYLEGLIENLETVVGYFGTYPSLHDARIDEIVIEPPGPSLKLIISGFVWFFNQQTDEYEARNDKEGILTLRCENLLRVEMEDDETGIDWNEINEILTFGIEKKDESLLVEIVPSYGLSARILCSRISVESVEPVS